MAHIIGSNSADDLHGTNSADTIEGRGGNDSLWGHGGNDLLIGGSGHDDLDGGSGADRMEGGSGDDYYFVDSTADQVVELANEGIDAVFADLGTFTLGANVEDLIAVSSADFHGIGNALDNYIYGYSGDDILDGGAGSDVLSGHLGDDTFYVDDAGDEVVEYAHEGHDTVITSLAALTLAANVEDLIFDGAGPFSGTGNARDNYIEGGAGADLLDGRSGDDLLNGGAGADQMIGGTGDDTYFVENANDQASELSGGGSDTVITNVSYTLGAGQSVELLRTYGSATTDVINLTGNELANTIVGNAAANAINGGGGIDAMYGYAGNDTYYVDNSADTVFEAASAGSDTIISNVSYTLGAGQEVELLRTYGSATTNAVNFTGNALANTIVGNAAVNQLDGKGGADSLYGYGGADSFAFTTAIGGGNVDAIGDFQAGIDEILLENAVFTGLVAGPLDPNAFHTGSAAADATDRIIYNSATGALLFDVDGFGGAAAVQFATLGTGLGLAASDFTVI